MTSRTALIVNNTIYEGWKGGSILRTAQGLTGSFNLTVADRWTGRTEPWPIYEEDECRVVIDDENVIDGFVDRVDLSFGDNTIAGRDRASALVDCSAILDNWTFRQATVVDIARKLCAPFGIGVSVQDDLELLPAPRKVVVSPGETAFTVIAAAAKAAGVMVVSDGAGGILITRAGTQRASQSLIEGVNILPESSSSHDATSRYSRYVVSTQFGGTDNASGPNARSRAEATDSGVRRTSRVLYVQPPNGLTAKYASQYADWEARMRAAQSQSATVQVHGWKQSDGALWPLNALVHVKSPRLRLDGDMRISQAEHIVETNVTNLRLVRPDAFTPEPSAIVKARS